MSAGSLEDALDAVESLALLELDGIGTALRVQDAMLKHAPVEFLACAPVSPGKTVLLFFGEVAPVEEAFTLGARLAGSRLLDSLHLPFIHPAVVAAVRGAPQHGSHDVAVLELSTLAATLLACDVAVKGAAVLLERLHLATGFGGKGFLMLRGELCDLEAAVGAVSERLGDRLLDAEIIAAPHHDLLPGAFLRPWGLDPAVRVDHPRVGPISREP